MDSYVKLSPKRWPFSGIPGSVQIKMLHSGVDPFHDPLPRQVRYSLPISLYPVSHPYCAIAPYCVSPLSLIIPFSGIFSGPQSMISIGENAILN